MAKKQMISTMTAIQSSAMKLIRSMTIVSIRIMARQIFSFSQISNSLSIITKQILSKLVRLIQTALSQIRDPPKSSLSEQHLFSIQSIQLSDFKQTKVIFRNLNIISILQHNCFFNSQMQQLLADPQTLRFKKGKHINLGILKKEINRRVIKIKTMLGYPQLSAENKVASYGCQTQNIQLNGQTIEGIKQSSVLSLQKSTVNLPVQSNHKPLKYAGRCSLPVRKQSGKKVDQNEPGKSTRIRVSQYLQTAKAKDIITSVQENASQVNVDQELARQENQFSNNEFDIFNLFKHSKKKSQLYIEKCDYNKLSQLMLCRSPDQKFNQVQLESDNYDLQQMRSSVTAAKGMSLKKNRFTERTALEQEKRYFITEETIQKMNIGVSKLIVKKRREAQDNKPRQNIFKKIDDKYGEYFDNI